MRHNNFTLKEISQMNLTDFEMYHAMVVKRLKDEMENKDA